MPADEESQIEDLYEFINYLTSSSEHFYETAKSNKSLQSLITFMFKILNRPSDSIIKINAKQ